MIKINTLRHISGKYVENNRDKEKSNKKNVVIYKGLKIRMPSEFSTTTMKTERQWLQLHRENSFQLRILYSAKLSIKCVQTIKTSLDI